MSRNSYKQKAKRTRVRGSAVWTSGLLVVAAMCGCAEWNLNDSLTFLPDPKPQTPDRVVAVWTNATLHQPGKRAVRGFGGRLMFHADGEEDPVLVDGRLTVYAFDDENPDPNDPSPEKKYVFPAELMPKHQSESALGPSYSFWLPWDELGGRQRQIGLIARFEDASGKKVASTIAHLNLPGTVPKPSDYAPANHNNASAPDSQRGYPAQQVSYEKRLGKAAGGYTGENPKMATTTIDLPPRVASRLLGGRGSHTASDRAATLHAAKADTSLKRERWTQPTTARASSASETTQQTSGQPSPGPEQPLQPAASPSTRFGNQRFQVRDELTTPPFADRVRRQPHHAEWPRRLPPTPRSSWNRPRTGSIPDDPQAPY